MKKLILALTIVSMFVLCFGALSVNAARLAPYLSQFTQEDVPAEDDRHYLPLDGGSWYMEWDLTPESILDGYDPREKATFNNLYCNGIGQLDNNKKVAGFNFGSPVTADAFVFADGFTAYGSQYGHSRMKPSDWEERYTFYSSLDGKNWTQIPFTVSYHIDAHEFTDIWMGNTTGDIDLFWHINFEAPVTGTWFMIHTSNESHQDDALYKLAIACNADLWYLLLSDEQVTPDLPVETEAPSNIPTIAPEDGERDLLLEGRTNRFAQRPAFTDNGDGTFSVVCKNGADEVNSWTDNVTDGQWTDQNTEGQVWWNNYFPCVHYADGVTATELVWNIHELNDLSDIEDYEIWYTEDMVSWKKLDGVTIARYAPALSTGGTEIDASCGARFGIRFIFDRPITAKCFFAYDPNPTNGNVFHWTPYFVAAYNDEVKAPETQAPATQAPETQAPETQAPETENNNADTADFALASLAVAAVAAAGVVLVSKKRKH